VSDLVTFVEAPILTHKTRAESKDGGDLPAHGGIKKEIQTKPAIETHSETADAIVQHETGLKTSKVREPQIQKW